jgi:hypothetical protein
MNDNTVSISYDQFFQGKSDREIIIDYINTSDKSEEDKRKLITNVTFATAADLAQHAEMVRAAFIEQMNADVERVEMARRDSAQIEVEDNAEEEYTDDNTYTLVENFVVNHPQASGKEIAIYCLLAARAHMPKKSCKASIAKLAQRTRWERPTVKKALDNLIAMGAVEQGDRDPGGAYTWILPHRHRSKPKKRRAA